MRINKLTYNELLYIKYVGQCLIRSKHLLSIKSKCFPYVDS